MSDELRKIETLLKNATGPDRELDARIWAEVDGRDVRDDLTRGMMLAKSRKPPHDECVIGYIDPGKRSRNFSADGFRPGPQLPAYTASIDAALSLLDRVLPKSGWLIGRGRLKRTEPLYGATVHASDLTPMSEDPEELGGGEGPTPAVALCLAIVSAALTKSKSP